MVLLGVDSPFFSAVLLFNNQIRFPLVFGGFLERFGSLGSEWKWKLPQPWETKDESHGGASQAGLRLGTSWPHGSPGTALRHTGAVSREKVGSVWPNPQA